MPTVSTHPKSAIGHESTNIFHHHHHNDVIQPTIAQEVLKIFSLTTNASVDESIGTNGTDIIYNITFNETFPGEENEALGDWILMGMLSVLLGLMILVTVIGNVFVIAAIFMERNLQNVANHLIVSLAVADLMVACLVMPLGAVYVISNNWIMGAEVCDMWTTIDVLCCTASILHLVAIAMDRYWAVTNVVYTRNSHRIRIMIILIWSVALIVSLAPQVPQFGWKDPEYMNRINIKKQCLVSQDVGYQIFATSSTFYAPLLIIFILYWKIFQTARKRIRKRREMRNHNVGAKNSSNSKGFVAKRRFLRLKKSNGKAADVLVTSIAMVEGQSTTTTELLEEEEEHQLNGNNQETKVEVVNNVSPEKISLVNESSMSQVESEANRAEASQKASSAKLLPSRKDRKETLEAKRERKAAKTLAIITGAFVICWLPFFILALVMPLCGESCSISPYVMSFFLWLGYFNSTLNPVIYTVFNPEFRQAFKRILCGQHRKSRRNLR